MGEFILSVAYALIAFAAAFTVYLAAINKLAKDRHADWLQKRWTRGFIRTPDERFENLPGYDFEPHYVEIDGLRMHYIDEGPRDGETVLLLHGEPSWCYLYRKMIPPLRDAGFRVVAPDLVGFGRSDKLLSRLDYTYQMHVDMMARFIDELGLDRVNLFGQDWGGLIGLRVVADRPQRFARVAVANTSLPGAPPRPPGGGRRPMLMPIRSFIGFVFWLLFSQLAPRLTAGAVIGMGTATRPSSRVIAAYDAPFPSSRYMAGARMFPALVPSQFTECTRAWENLGKFDKPFITLFGDRDPVLGGGEKVLQKAVPGASGQNHSTIRNASHFLQEDQGEDLAEKLIEFIESNRKGESP